MKLIMLGAPGAGKGTQAKKIAEKYQIPAVATLPMDPNFARLVDKLVPDEVTIGMLLDRISQDDSKNGYVLDGFPRTIPQAESLTAALKERGENIDYAVNVDVPDENIVNRMSGRRACVGCGATYHVVYNAPKTENICDTCGEKLILRDDDKPETVQNRLHVYHDQTQPLIDYYKNEGVLVEVDGTQDLEKVFQDIVAVLG